ncbi:MAG: tRNA (adenosine(37)-N6)-threonylcarbamoyltransferase complex transferase subunit TsaD [Atopobiaceae bacterium]|nr:tRNA (adenosine(37)-N6)-threonylcarbamoyltransferase complex transferase subunit TsaD [Atopobiaceae bacterium]
MTTEKPLIVLALDTSTDMLACAVAEWTPRPGTADVRVLAAGDHLCRRMSNVELTTTALDLLAQAGKTMADVDAVLVGRGPGSFTGVRIGIATAKGLACGLGCPLHGASTLDAVAWRAWLAGARGLVAVADDAMRGEVYPGIYQLDDDGPHRTFGRETVLKADACAAEWAARSDANQLQLTGDGLKRHRAKFEEAGFSTYLDESLWHPTAEALLRAAASPDNYDAAETGDPALVLPVYTRLSDAEENERKRLGLGKSGFVESSGVAEELAGIHLQLRPMSLNDLEAVAALEEEVYGPSPQQVWTRNMFYEATTVPGSTWWVAHDRGQVVGFAGAQLAGDGVDILDVVVAPARRREGIARRLLARVTYDGQMLGATSATLEVLDGNEPAQTLYESLGFERVGLRRDYYGRGHDAIVMTAALPLALEARDDRPDPTSQVRPWPIACAPRTDEAADAIVSAGLVLAIESSCDETAVAVLDREGTVCSSVVATQIDFHARFGGVVPEIASRKHTEAIVGVFEEALAKAGEHFGVDTLVPADLTCVAVTEGPGLVGALVVGVAFAKGLCAACDLPLVGVNHLEGHLYANLFETPDLEPPFVASLVSGGNTMLVHVRDWGDYHILGETIDDAVGEAFDKVAKALGLGYPGGPAISRLAAQGNPKAIPFPRAMLHSHDYCFSLSGLKTAVITYIEGENRAGRPIDLPDLAASFQAAVVDVQVAKAVTAVRECGVDDFCVGGGVAANPALRSALQEAFGQMGVRVTVPPLAVCGDNAAMIGLVALRLIREGKFVPLTMDANPNLRLTHKD